MGEAMTNQCQARVWTSGGFHSHQCKKSAKVKRDGMFYCRIHDPIEKAKKQKVRDQKWDAEWKAKQASWERRAIEQVFCHGTSTEDIQRLIDGNRPLRTILSEGFTLQRRK